jgi:hypothetical protein
MQASSFPADRYKLEKKEMLTGSQHLNINEEQISD